MKEVEVVIVYHSTRGHTKMQAEAVFEGAKSVEFVKARLLTCETATEQLDSLDVADLVGAIPMKSWQLRELKDATKKKAGAFAKTAFSYGQMWSSQPFTIRTC